MQSVSEEKKEIIRDKLARCRQDLLGFLGELDERDWEAVVYSEGAEWSATDLLRHLVDAERGMTMLITRILEGGEGAPADFDLTRWNARVIEKEKEKTAGQLVKEIKENRPVLLEVIASLGEGDWGKRGRHASLRIMSVEEICHLIADHERNHVEDMRQALANRHKK
jgi:hypothetical protein